MSTYPIYLKLEGRTVCLVGGGQVAARKAKALLSSGAKLRIVAKTFENSIKLLSRNKNVILMKSAYRKSLLKGAVIVIAATNDNKLNNRIANDCRKLKILCNVVDEPDLCDFFVPAVVRRGLLQIAISTDGLCPAYAKRLRQKFETIILPIHSDFLTALEAARNQAKKKISDEEKRKDFLDRITADESFEYFCRNGRFKWNEYIEQLFSGETK